MAYLGTYEDTSTIETDSYTAWPIDTMITRLSPNDFNPQVIWNDVTHIMTERVGVVELDNILYRVPLWNRLTEDGNLLLSADTQRLLVYQIGDQWDETTPVQFRWYPGQYVIKSINSEMTWMEMVNRGVDPNDPRYPELSGEAAGRRGHLGGSRSTGTGRKGSAARASTEIYEAALNVGNYLDSYYNSLMPKMQIVADAVLRERASQSDNSAWMRGGIITNSIKQRLLDRGFTSGQTDWFMARGRLTLPDQFSPEQGKRVGIATGSVPLPDESVPELAPVKAATVITVKAPFGYLRPDPSLIPDLRPQLVQYYSATDPNIGRRIRAVSSGRPIPQVEVFHFPYIPQDIQYSGLGSEWTEIPRAADMPAVEWSRWHLMKATMEFLIAERGDGIFQSVHEELEKLRRMAQRPYPISVYGMDSLLRISMRRAEQTGKPLEFVIADLSLGSLRRTMRAGDKEITAAQVKLTLQEIPIEEIRLARFPVPGFTEDVDVSAPDDTGECLGLFTDNISDLSDYHKVAGQESTVIDAGDGCTPTGFYPPR